MGVGGGSVGHRWGVIEEVLYTLADLTPHRHQF